MFGPIYHHYIITKKINKKVQIFFGRNSLNIDEEETDTKRIEKEKIGPRQDN